MLVYTVYQHSPSKQCTDSQLDLGYKLTEMKLKAKESTKGLVLWHLRWHSTIEKVRKWTFLATAYNKTKVVIAIIIFRRKTNTTCFLLEHSLCVSTYWFCLGFCIQECTHISIYTDIYYTVSVNRCNLWPRDHTAGMKWRKYGPLQWC